LFEAIEIQATLDAGAHRAFADVQAVAQGLAARVGGCIAWRRGDRGEQPATQLGVGLAVQPQAPEPFAGGGFAGQADADDAAILNAHALAHRTARVVVGQHWALVQAQ